MKLGLNYYFTWSISFLCICVVAFSSITSALCGCPWADNCGGTPNCSEFYLSLDDLSDETNPYIVVTSNWVGLSYINTDARCVDAEGTPSYPGYLISTQSNDDGNLTLWLTNVDSIPRSAVQVCVRVIGHVDWTGGCTGKYTRLLYVDLSTRPSATPSPTPEASPPVASFKSLNVVELGRSDEETYDGAHMVGGSIRFDPTASYDADGQIITYEWDFDNGNKFSTDAPNIYDVIFQEASVVSRK